MDRSRSSSTPTLASTMRWRCSSCIARRRSISSASPPTFGNGTIDTTTRNALYLTRALRHRRAGRQRRRRAARRADADAPPDFVHGAQRASATSTLPERIRAQARSAAGASLHHRHGPRQSGRDHHRRGRPHDQSRARAARGSRASPGWCARSSSWAARSAITASTAM